MTGIIDPKKYFAAIVAGLLIIGLAIGSFVWSVVTHNSVENAEEEIGVENSTVILEPVNLGTPTSAPSVPFPEKGPGEE